jgi:flagellar motility protein MotE (MotC chaperone)
MSTDRPPESKEEPSDSASDTAPQDTATTGANPPALAESAARESKADTSTPPADAPEPKTDTSTPPADAPEPKTDTSIPPADAPDNSYIEIDGPPIRPGENTLLITPETPRLTDAELITLFELQEKPLIRFAQHFGLTGSQWNYVASVPVNYGIVFSEVIPDSAGIGLTLGWNYFDAIYAINVGLLQLQDEENYRQEQMKAKGLLGVISGLQILLLSYNPLISGALLLSGGAALAAPVFALHVATEVVACSIDFYNAYIENNFTGWLEERAKEIAYDQKRIDKFRLRLNKIYTGEKNAKPHEVDYLKAKIKYLETKIKDMEATMDARSRVFCHSDEPEKKAENSKTVKNIVDKYMPPAHAAERNKQLQTAMSAEDRDTDKKIQQQLAENYRKSMFNLSLKTASFVGITLLAVSSFVVCPPVLFAGLAITAVVAAVYIYRNSEKIASWMKKLGLFKSKKEEDQIDLPLKNTPHPRST